jgi:four helix bundle protein
MVAYRFEDLVVWQLADGIKNEVYEITARRPAAGDIKFCDQIRESARSAPRNIAEGFGRGRYCPREFGQFLRIALASLHETKNHLHDGRDRRYLSDSDHERIVRMTLRAIKAGNRLAAYLRSAKAPEAPPTGGEPRKPENPSNPPTPENPGNLGNP